MAFLLGASATSTSTQRKSACTFWADAGCTDVDVGSYPKWMDATYKTKLTFDGRDAGRVDAARDAFVKMLPDGEPQRVD